MGRTQSLLAPLYRQRLVDGHCTTIQKRFFRLGFGAVYVRMGTPHGLRQFRAPWVDAASPQSTYSPSAHQPEAAMLVLLCTWGQLSA